ncbi:hypothetical protein EPUL_002491, partial [Erysiphe pulchra]
MLKKNYVISWLHQTNEGEVRKSQDDSFVRIHSHDFLQNSLKRRKKPAASFDSSIIEEPVRTSLKNDIENSEKNELTEKPNNESLYLAKSIPTRYDSVQNEDSYLSASFPETVFKKRMRYKTREDRYEIDKKKKIKLKKEAKTSEKSRRNRRKSNKCVHEKPLPSFSSRKIGTDRLTFKTSNNRGIFKNGRASSPITRRGIPDLSFSEMEFLQNSRKVLPIDNGYPTKKKGRLKAKCRNLENDEISSFFKPSTVSFRVNNDKYYLRSSDGLIRDAESTSGNPGLPIIDKKNPFLNRRARIGSFSNCPSQSSSTRSYGSIKHSSSSIAKSHFSFSETKDSSHGQAFNLIRDTHNHNHLKGPYIISRSITPTYIKSKNKGTSVVNASLDDQSTHSNLRMTNIGQLSSNTKNNLNAQMNLKEEKEDKIIENNMKHVGTMTTYNLDQELNVEQKKENFLSPEIFFSTKTHESTEISNVLKIPTKSVRIKRPSTAVPILRASLEKDFPFEVIHNLHNQNSTKIGSIASLSLIAEAVLSPSVQLVKEHNQEEKYQFLSQLQNYRNSNEHIPNNTINSSPISMGYTYTSLLAEDTQFIGTKHSFDDAYDQQDDQSEFIDQKIYYNNDSANLDGFNSRNIEYKKDENESFQNETIIGLSQLDDYEAYKKSPEIISRTPFMASNPQEFEHLTDTDRFIEEQNDMEGFWDIHR